MKIFITGASGFIGKHLLHNLVNEGHQVTINVRKTCSTLNKNVKTFTINEEDINETIRFFKEQSFDGVIHLASLYITNHTSDDIFNLINSNVRFSAFTLEAAS